MVRLGEKGLNYSNKDGSFDMSEPPCEKAPDRRLPWNQYFSKSLVVIANVSRDADSTSLFLSEGSLSSSCGYP